MTRRGLSIFKAVCVAIQAVCIVVSIVFLVLTWNGLRRAERNMDELREIQSRSRGAK